MSVSQDGAYRPDGTRYGDDGVSKHTMAPWIWTDGTSEIDIATYNSPGYYNNPELHGADGSFIVGCDEYWTVGPKHDAPTMVANANLIAAAPEMLEALKEIAAIKDAMTGGDWDEIEGARSIARAAIAKAEGRK